MIISFHYFRSLLIATCFFAFTHPAMGATFVSEYGAYNSANSVYLEFPAGGRLSVKRLGSDRDWGQLL